ncbi:peroxiredoxin family protein [Blastococcus sp. CT_GayMR19]|uniref:peroxiredoxin family protein n=1 Tax=Blastococcus sp. CT_GayMR19 TaxID=2559608 RepID=UPI001FD75930|nr:peroxiredoxin family protein [Blastococcus sp. CT_GayMR19]
MTTWILAGLAVALVVGGLYAVFRDGRGPSSSTATSERFQVGSPGPGDPAPDFTLPATDGQDVALDDLRGENVLLYLHEGLGCQPCWDQIRDMEQDPAQLAAAGIDRLVSITSAPRDLLAQKMRDDGLQSVALADPTLAVIRAYEANKYGMMGDSRAGHTFILVNGDGQIVWRADYGGAPNYTMYVPVEDVLADLQGNRLDS